MITKSQLLGFLLAASSISAFSQVAYTGKPMYNILVKRAGIPIGNIKIELFPNIAYHHTRNFDSLVSVNFYDTTAFHRVIPGFMIQGGDPNSRHGNPSTWGYGQPGQPLVNAEFSAAKHLRGILSAARLGNNVNSATSQFFICVAPAPQLDGNYSIYGQTIAGINIVDTIVLAPRNPQDRPNLKHEMFVTYIGSNDAVPVAPLLQSPPRDSVGVDSSSYLTLKWKTVSDAIIYHVDVSTDSTFANTDLSLDLASTSTYFTNMAGNTRYYWRVRTNNGGHFSPWSPTWNFHTFGQTTGIRSYAPNQNDVSVFPNPGNGNFTFSDVVPGSLVSIYDANGKVVFEALARSGIVTANLEHKDKGLYFYKVSLSGSKTFKGELIIK
jgi:peptidyl-prolyl cis-trans isomerase B (cyclophilin B)